MSCRPARRLLVTALLLALPVPAAADERGQAHAHERARTLDAVEVTASPLGNAVDELARPVEVLAGETLDARKAGTLGETVERLPGVQSSFFGAGVGRPVIRGQDGARVQVLNGGTGAFDVSTVSADHAVTLEPFLADQIEVLKGPATLLYGSGAIGGAVNVVDGRVPTAPVGRATSGRAELRYGTGADEVTGMVRFDADAGAVTLHADYFRREADDYEIPGHAWAPGLVAGELEEGADPSDLARGTLPNSRLTTQGGAVGATWFGEHAWLGAAASTYRSDYGIPPGTHAHVEAGNDHGGADAGAEEFVRLDLRQDRFDLRGGWRGLGPLRELNLRLTTSRYEHTEFEGAEVGTVFRNDGLEARLEAVQQEWNGWRGAFGLQFGARDFEAIGDEAFVPPSESRDLGLFVVQERAFGDLKLEFGARHDRIALRPEGAATTDFGATSLAVGGLWQLNDTVHLSLNLDRAERAPTAEELFSDGPHIATRSYEVGDAGLGKERALGAELGLHLHAGQFEGELAVFRTAFDDFIYLADTGLALDALPVRAWVQGDARFTGWEAEGRVDLAENAGGLWQLRVFADGVAAELDDGTPLPRIAPMRAGVDLEWRLGGWRARLGALRVAEQDEVAPGEEATPGYTLVDAGLAYHWDRDRTGWELFLEGRNLTDREARAHTSFLKDVAPLPGRNVAAGMRVSF